MPAKGTTPALTPDQAAKYDQVVQLKIIGRTFDEIAQVVGYADRSGAKRAYDAALKRMGREAVEEVRQLEHLRLENLWASASAKLLALPDNELNGFLQIQAQLLRISARRSGLLGLDAPRQVEITGAGGGPIRTDIGEVLRERADAIKSRYDLQAPAT